ncbi:hypothetical protein N7508_008271 [Penicillium antarcticum]|uniref:uncharacterized protein n=1 Tax=Penicillium antarcticum TaxID=416450 RepID=UPI002392681A|nr:uncharacterized protein N7508_008271 [Penicillium antarcticum]KAJ5298022.1 hypothetical protein N7508_008271 [Penicillium antarcticum]
MANLPEVLVIGGTGAQGAPVVQGSSLMYSLALADSGRYRVRILTRDTDSTRVKSLAALQNVTLFQGAVTSQEDLHAAFRGVYGAWVNIDGFTLGEGTKSSTESVPIRLPARRKLAPTFGPTVTMHAGRLGRMRNSTGVIMMPRAELAGQQGMKSTLFTTGPYMNMLLDGMFVPKTESDGTVVWENPAKDGKLPLIALEDVGNYNLWIFDNIDQSAGLDLEVATDQVTFNIIAEIFTRVTGKPAIHRAIPMDKYIAAAEPYPGAPVN